ncbi:hypothetical protein [Pantoea sp. CCBC3-3-1]|uniref:hypothetical protein n=1 Tax=Pantoea sp. CCBC3-3-1 TaxID=2490851 RepID=UPI00352B9AC1
MNEKRGQSMTVSELKSAVLAIIQTLHHYLPLKLNCGSSINNEPGMLLRQRPSSRRNDILSNG